MSDLLTPDEQKAYDLVAEMYAPTDELCAALERIGRGDEARAVRGLAHWTLVPLLTAIESGEGTKHEEGDEPATLDSIPEVTINLDEVTRG